MTFPSALSLPRAELRLALRAVTRPIAGEHAPPWLAELFEQWAPGLALDRMVHERQPTKVEMKRRMNEINRRAAGLRNLLNETDTSEFLAAAGRIEIENPGGLLNALLTIAERAKDAAAFLSNTKSKTRAGRGKALPPGAFSPKVYCAILIAETWKYFHGEYPLPQNRAAAEAAHALWCLTGGQAKGWGNDPLNGWKPHFVKAQATEATKERVEWRRHLAQSALLSEQRRSAGI